jgi:hypothetical protein
MTNEIIKHTGTFDSDIPPRGPSLQMVRSKKTLEQWIKERACDPDKDGQLSAVALEHLSGNVGTVLHRKVIGQNSINPKEIAEMFLDIARTHCQDLEGNHTFRFSAFYSNLEQAEAVYLFALQGQRQSDYLGNESPTKEGLLSHGLGYATRTTERAYSAIDSAMMRMNALLDSTNQTMQILQSGHTRLMVENHTAYEMMKQLLLDKAMSEHQMEFEKFKYERATGERAKWLRMGMAAVNQISGREVFPSAEADHGLMEELADLPEDKLQKLTEALQDKPALLALIASRLEQVVDGGKKLTHHVEEKALAATNVEVELGEEEAIGCRASAVGQQEPQEAIGCRQSAVGQQVLESPSQDIQVSETKSVVLEPTLQPSQADSRKPIADSQSLTDSLKPKRVRKRKPS